MSSEPPMNETSRLDAERAKVPCQRCNHPRSDHMLGIAHCLAETYVGTYADPKTYCSCGAYRTSEPGIPFPAPAAHPVAMSPYGQSIAVVYSDGTVWCLHGTSWKPLPSLPR